MSMVLKRPPLNQAMSWSPYSPQFCCMARKSFSMRRAALLVSLRAWPSRSVKMLAGSRCSSSANMQNRHWTRKWATCWPSPPRRRMAAASSAKWPAASAVIAAVDFSGRSFSGSVNTQRRICRCSGSTSCSMRISRGSSG